MARPARAPMLLLAIVLVAGLSGCERRPDDEMVVPSVTRTAEPEPPADLPDLPTGKAGPELAGRLRVHGSTVVIGDRSIDVAPMRIDAHVVTPGGIYFDNRGELWFTDLDRITPTPYQRIRGLRLSPDERWVVFVDLAHGSTDGQGVPRPLRVRYNAVSGVALDATYLEKGS